MYLGPSYRAGVRVVHDDGAQDVAWQVARGWSGLEDARRFARYVEGLGSDLMRPCLLPCRIESLTKELMRATRDAQEEGGWLVRLHCMQDRQELAFLDQWYGQDPLSVLAETGLLTDRLLVPHAVHLGGLHPTEGSRLRDLQRLAAAGATVIHCPWTSARYGTVMNSFSRYKHAGVRLALGSDSFPPDLIRVMDYGTNIAKIMTGRADITTAADLFRAATLGGARALGRPDLGRLCVGAAADLIVVDLDNPPVGPIDDPIRTMLMQGSGANVRTVIIGGRVVMEDWQIPGVDWAELQREVQSVFETLKGGYSERDFRHRTVAELFPSSFPIVRSSEVRVEPCPASTTDICSEN